MPTDTEAEQKANIQAAIDAGLITWDSINAGLRRIAAERSEWAGLPMPVQGYEMMVEPRFPYQKLRVCNNADVNEGQHDDTLVINEWFNERLQTTVGIGEKHGKRFAYLKAYNRTEIILGTLACATAWRFDAEIKAHQKLCELIGMDRWEAYMMTGAFGEKSKRSGIIYIFRKLRPTIAIKDQRVLCALCLHPIGYYAGTNAGVMVPTDDVIAHLVMMRGSEEKFWANANQHPAHRPQSGI